MINKVASDKEIFRYRVVFSSNYLFLSNFSKAAIDSRPCSRYSDSCTAHNREGIRTRRQFLHNSICTCSSRCSRRCRRPNQSVSCSHKLLHFAAMRRSTRSPQYTISKLFSWLLNAEWRWRTCAMIEKVVKSCQILIRTSNDKKMRILY